MASLSDTPGNWSAAMEEKQNRAVTVWLGKTHHQALCDASKKIFGRANRAGLVRLLIDEWMRKEIEAAATAMEVTSGRA